jgi:glycosyltransferase involved in cell wall biosynthesis
MLLVSFVTVLLRRVDVIFFADGVAGALAPLLRPFTRSRFVTTIYGLEMTYRNPIARRLMARGAKTCDRVVVISENTRHLTERLGVPSETIVKIYVGVEPLALPEERCDQLRKRFEREHGIRFGQDRVLLNFGRLIPRKGVAAFLEHGMPLLEKDIKLIIGGGGPDLEKVRRIRREKGLQERIILLESPSDEMFAMLRQSADLFLFPSVPTPGDAEGFGMTQLESMYSGTPAVAFAVDALVESVREGGYLVTPNDYQAFADQIHAFYAFSSEEREAKRREAREYVRREYSWERTVDQYLDVFAGRR